MKLALLSIFLALPVFAQTSPALPNQVVFISTQWDQASTPAFTGGVGYAKLISGSVYTYTHIRETAVTFGSKPAIQTQTETGLCAYTFNFASINIYSCGTAGLATAGSSTGVSATGQVLATRAMGKKGFFVGGYGGPSYSGVLGRVSFPVGAVFGFGTH